jgi:hypothetical protein
VTYEAAVARVTLDSDRALSKDPELLRLALERVHSLLPDLPPSEWVFDTTQISPRDIVDTLVDTLVPPGVVVEPAEQDCGWHDRSLSANGFQGTRIGSYALAGGDRST